MRRTGWNKTSSDYIRVLSTRNRSWLSPRSGALSWQLILLACLVSSTAFVLTGKLATSVRDSSSSCSSEELGNCRGLWIPIHGIYRHHICKYLASLLPLRTRFQIEPKFQPIQIGKSITPICMISSTAEQRNHENVQIAFYKPTNQPLYLDEKIRYGTISLLEVGEGLVLTLWPKANDSGTNIDPPIQILLREEMLNGVAIDVPTSRSLSKELLSEHMWPSGAFFKTAQGSMIAAVHKKWYNVGIYTGQNWSSLDEARVTGFENAGGENIGSIFEQSGDVFVAARVVLPQHLHSMSGHGHRQAGVFKLNACMSNGAAHGFHGELVMQYGSDEVCCRNCGGCADELKFQKCSISADKWWNCKKPPEDATGRKLWAWSIQFSKHLETSCLRNATTGDCDSFIQYYTCVHECRSRNEIYHSAVAEFGGVNFGLVSLRNTNEVLFCPVDSTVSSYFCLEQVMLKLDESRQSHPYMSSLATTEHKILVAGVSHDSDSRRNDKLQQIVVHSWQRDLFCKASQSTTSIFATVQVRVALASRIMEILYTPLLQSMACSSSQIKIAFSPRHSVTCKPNARTGSYDTCSCYVKVSRKCLTVCKFVIRFYRAHIVGLRAK